MTGNALLRVDGLHAGYGRSTILDGVSFDVFEGEIVAILGANGAGKTTILRALSGLIKISKGSVNFAGANVTGTRPEVLARRGIAHVPEGRGTFTGLTVRENLTLGGGRLPRREIANQMEKWFGVFPRLQERREQRAGSLSGGEQQMLAIARAMMPMPRLLLLDEPSMGLAPKITQQVFQVLREVHAELGTTMVIVEQNANIALKTASRAFVIGNGTIEISGTAEELSSDNRIRQAYLQA